jgi:hypothetical protein
MKEKKLDKLKNDFKKQELFQSNEIQLFGFSITLDDLDYEIKKMSDGLDSISELMSEVKKVESGASSSDASSIEEISYDASEWDDEAVSAMFSFVESIVNFKNETIEMLEHTFEEKLKTKNETSETVKSLISELDYIEQSFNAWSSGKDESLPKYDMNNSFGSARDIKNINSEIADIAQLELDVSEAESALDEIFGHEDYEDDVPDYEKALSESQRVLSDTYSSIDYKASSIYSDLETLHEMSDTFVDVLMGFKGDLESIYNNILSNMEELDETSLYNSADEYKVMIDKTLPKMVLESKELQHDINIELHIPGNNKFSGHWMIFKDGSVLADVMDGRGYYSYPNDKDTFKGHYKNMIESNYAYQNRKNPIIGNYLLSRMEKGDSIDTLDSMNTTLNENKHIIKKYDINLDLWAFQRSEKLYDALQEYKFEHNADKIVSKELSKNYQKLNTQSVRDSVSSWVRMGFDHSLFKSYVSKKMAYFNNQEDGEVKLANHIKETLEKLSGWGEISLLSKAKNNSDVEIIKSNKDQTILYVPSYNSCNDLGSPSWCIKRNSGFFNRYNEDGDLYIYCDFTKSPTNPESMIGIHLSEKGISASHLRNDHATSKEIKNRIRKEIISSDIDGFATKIAKKLGYNEDHKSHVVADLQDEMGYLKDKSQRKKILGQKM